MSAEMSDGKCSGGFHEKQTCRRAPTKCKHSLQHDQPLNSNGHVFFNVSCLGQREWHHHGS